MFSTSATSGEEVVPWFDRGRLWRDSGKRPSQSLHYATADYYIQDAGSLLALALLDVQPNEVVCDLCAAPGGKASGIAEMLGEHGFLLANEPIGSRVSILRYALSRTGSLRYAVSQMDPDPLADRFEGLFDAVLVDAPCSGQAMVGRGKREANAFDSKQVEHSARRQCRILMAACRLLKPGGRLVYSTCTFAFQENEAQMRFLQDQFPGCFEPMIAPRLQGWASPIELGCYRLWPHRDPTSGAFAAGLRMISPLEKTGKQGRKGKKGAAMPKRAVRDRHRFEGEKVIEEFGQIHQMQICESERGGEACGVPIDVAKEIRGLVAADELPKLAVCRNGVWKPDFSLAMLNPTWFEPHRTVEISQAEASEFVRGEALSLHAMGEKHEEPFGGGGSGERSDVPWMVLRWQQKPLGWAKFAGNRLNNHLPPQALLTIGSNDESGNFGS
jgi:NOL1/NOP2/fmu family ribosome biogenesis protein/SAM-dependent methyltransferase